MAADRMDGNGRSPLQEAKHADDGQVDVAGVRVPRATSGKSVANTPARNSTPGRGQRSQLPDGPEALRSITPSVEGQLSYDSFHG